MSEAPAVDTPNPTPNSDTPAPAAPAPAAAAPPAAADPPAADDAPWYAGLPDDLKTQPGVTRHKSLTDAIQAGIAAEKRLGVPADQILRVPTKPDDKEAYGAIYKALGAPDTADGYKLDLTGASDDDKGTVEAFTAAMHEAGPFPPAFLQAATSWFIGETQKAAEAQAAEDTAASQAAEAALKTEWGAAFDEKKTAIGKLVVDLGGQELADELDLDTKIGNSPALARFLAKITDRMAEPGPTGDSQNAKVSDGKLTPGEAKNARFVLESDPVKGKALRDGTHPQHKAVVAERDRLLAFEHPQPQGA